MRRLFIATIVSVIAASTVSTQTVLAPFVSRLKAQSHGTSVVLTWKDSSDAKGPLHVHRHLEEITDTNFGATQAIAQVPYGVGSYVDYPPDTQRYFYAVIAEDEEGKRYDLLIPFRNKTLSSRGAEELGSPEQIAAHVTGITAVGGAQSITVQFDSSRPRRGLILYRSVSPIRSYGALLGTVSTILDPGVLSYTDTPPAGLGYYYAVLDEELVKIGKLDLVENENMTTVPASIPLTEAEAARADGKKTSSRSRPLPDIVLSRTVYSGELVVPSITVPHKRTLSPESQAAVDELVSGVRINRAAPLRVRVLPVDLAVGGDSDQDMLRTIVENVVSTGELSLAEKALVSYLQIRRNSDVETRAHLYLGQVYYFQGRFAESLLEFLSAQEGYYAETNPWINACLSNLTEDD